MRFMPRESRISTHWIYRKLAGWSVEVYFWNDVFAVSLSWPARSKVGWPVIFFSPKTKKLFCVHVGLTGQKTAFL